MISVQVSIVAVCRFKGNLLCQETGIEENRLFCLFPQPFDRPPPSRYMSTSAKAGKYLYTSA